MVSDRLSSSYLAVMNTAPGAVFMITVAGQATLLLPANIVLATQGITPTAPSVFRGILDGRVAYPAVMNTAPGGFRQSVLLNKLFSRIITWVGLVQNNSLPVFLKMWGKGLNKLPRLRSFCLSLFLSLFLSR